MGSCLSHNNKEVPEQTSPPQKIPIHLKQTAQTEFTSKQPKNDSYHADDLLRHSFSNLQKFTYAGLITKAKVVDIYDGDTITIVFYHNGQPVKDSFRMFGYDAPEMKPRKNIENREIHIQAAQFVRQKLISQIGDKLIWVKFSEEEKYGRLMGEIFHISPKSPEKFLGNEQNINSWMIAKGYGKPYQGGHKMEFTGQDLHLILAS